MHSFGHERERVGERQRSLQDCLRRNPVRDVDDLHVGRDPLHDTVTGADEVVAQPEIRQERDEARHAAAESTSPSTLCVFASATTLTPAARAAPVVCGPIVIAGTPERSAPQARAADADASNTRSPLGGGPTLAERVRYTGRKSAGRRCASF